MKKFVFIFFTLITASIQSYVPRYFSHREYAYSTHQPVLQVIAEQTSGPIIEFGCGHGSTPLLHALCKEQKRTLITLEDHEGWMEDFSKRFIGDGYELDNSGWHKFYFVPGKKNNDDYAHWVAFMKESDIFKKYSFDLCFIDQSPWLARYETILHMKDKVRFIVLHDCDYFPHTGVFGKVIKASTGINDPAIFDFSDMFKLFKVYYPLVPWPGTSGPPTLLASNVEKALPFVDYSKY